jgi:hypothetical protein
MKSEYLKRTKRLREHCSLGGGVVAVWLNRGIMCRIRHHSPRRLTRSEPPCPSLCRAKNTRAHIRAVLCSTLPKHPSAPLQVRPLYGCAPGHAGTNSSAQLFPRRLPKHPRAVPTSTPSVQPLWCFCAFCAPDTNAPRRRVSRGCARLAGSCALSGALFVGCCGDRKLRLGRHTHVESGSTGTYKHVLTCSSTCSKQRACMHVSHGSRRSGGLASPEAPTGHGRRGSCVRCSLRRSAALCVEYILARALGTKCAGLAGGRRGQKTRRPSKWVGGAGRRVGELWRCNGYIIQRALSRPKAGTASSNERRGARKAGPEPIQARTAWPAYIPVPT